VNVKQTVEIVGSNEINVALAHVGACLERCCSGDEWWLNNKDAER
jgi:hypothetical protein